MSRYIKYLSIRAKRNYFPPTLSAANAWQGVTGRPQAWESGNRALLMASHSYASYHTPLGNVD